jgi:hypothetical protein
MQTDHSFAQRPQLLKPLHVLTAGHAMLQQVGKLEFIDASSGIRLCALL